MRPTTQVNGKNLLSHCFFLLADEWREDPNTTISIYMAFHWRADNDLVLNADWLGSFVISRGSEPVLLRKHIFL